MIMRQLTIDELEGVSGGCGNCTGQCGQCKPDDVFTNQSSCRSFGGDTMCQATVIYRRGS
jgi:hypothetical protein